MPTIDFFRKQIRPITIVYVGSRAFKSDWQSRHPLIVSVFLSFSLCHFIQLFSYFCCRYVIKRSVQF